jgi:tetratricopeptide (TPR) repeat protein
MERILPVNMSEKDTPREDSAAPTPSLSEEAGGKTPQCAGESAKRLPEQFHENELELFRQSLAGEGEKAYERWGMAMFHSLNDEDAETQRRALGFEPQDALDFYNRGCLLAQREDYAGAAKAFEQAVALDPKLSEAIFNRALALEYSGDKAAVRKAWQDYLEQSGDSEEAAEIKSRLEGLAGS